MSDSGISDLQGNFVNEYKIIRGFYIFAIPVVRFFYFVHVVQCYRSFLP